MPNHKKGGAFLVKNEWQPLLAACLLILCVCLGFGLVMSPISPWLPYKAAILNEAKISRPAPSKQEFDGLRQANPDDCYLGEHQGECAARIVQDRVAAFYKWLVVAAFAQVLGAVLAWDIHRKQRSIMAR
jgi:hypothetical protein